MSSSNLIENKLGPIQLGIILGTSLGITSMVVGSQLVQSIGMGSAIVVSLIGNLVLWLIGLSIVSMAKQKNDAIQNIKGYLGNKTGLLAAVILIPACIIWYVFQMQSAVVLFLNIFSLGEHNIYGLKIGVILGVLITILSIGGIKSIKWVGLIGFPILILITIFSLFHSSKDILFETQYSFSYFGLITIIYSWLAGYMNVPTFTRHCESKADAYLALSIMAILHTIFQISMMIVRIDYLLSGNHNFFGVGSVLNDFLVGLLILTSFLSINLINVYFSSAGWDAIFLKLNGRYKYPIISLLGMAVFLFYPLSSGFWGSPVGITENFLTILIVNLGVVLIVNALIRIIVKHRPRSFIKFWNSVCWLVGLMVASWFQFFRDYNSHESLLVGIFTILLAFLVLFFVEETVWSIKNLE